MTDGFGCALAAHPDDVPFLGALGLFGVDDKPREHQNGHTRRCVLKKVSDNRASKRVKGCGGYLTGFQGSDG